MKKLLTTAELKKHILKEYRKVKSIAKQDNVYHILDTKFEYAKAGSSDGEYCFSDMDGYHFRYLERGNIYTDKTTQDIFEITYQVLDSQLFWMSFEFERKNRIDGKGNRRLLFMKILQYFAAIGEEYAERAEYDINETLKKAPFRDGI